MLLGFYPPLKITITFGPILQILWNFYWVPVRGPGKYLPSYRPSQPRIPNLHFISTQEQFWVKSLKFEFFIRFQFIAHFCIFVSLYFCKLCILFLFQFRESWILNMQIRFLFSYYTEYSWFTTPLPKFFETLLFYGMERKNFHVVKTWVISTLGSRCPKGLAFDRA